MLKKQTIWLLTMLSLMIVLSVFYITQDPDKVAYIDGEQEDKTTTTPGKSTDDDEEVKDITNLGRDQLFSLLRLELQDERSMKKSRLNDIVASSNATTDEKNEAKSEINMIDEINRKESILQSTILAVTADYEDVLVRLDKEVVHVHIKVDELSKQEVVHIMQMVRDEFGIIPVNVDFQPTEG